MSLAATAAAAAVVAAPSPTPTPVPASLELTATPGLIGFLVVFAIAIVSIGLFYSLTRHLRVVERRARLEAEQEAGGPGATHGPEDPTAPPATGPGGPARGPAEPEPGNEPVT